MTRKIIGTATTDAQGVARLPYTVQGIGRIRVTAENGTIVSNLYDIIDAYYYNYYDGMILGSNMTKTVDDTGIQFTCSSGTSSVALRKKGASNNYNYVAPFTVEFDILSFGEGSNPNIQCYDTTTTINRTFSQLGITGPCHIKIEYNTDGTIYYVDGEKITELTSHCTGASRVYLNQITTLKINNPVIYNSNAGNITERVLTSLSLTSSSSSIDYGESVTLTVTARDQYNQAMSGVTVAIINNATSSTITTLTTGNNGTRTYTYTPSATGTLSLKANSGTVNSSNLSITVNPILASVSLSSSKSTMTTAETATLTVTAKDNDNNGMSGISVDIYNDSTKLTTVTTGTGGTQTYTFTPTTAGTYSLKAVSGTFESSTVDITVSNAPPALTTLTLASSESSMRVGESATITVTAKDQYNAGMSSVSVDIYNGSTKLTTVTTGSNGTKAYTFSPVSEGSYSLKAVSGNVESSAVAVSVLPAVASITVTGSASVIQSGGTSTLTVTALDSSSQGLSGVSLDIYKGSTKVDTVTTGSGGTATYTYTGTGAGDTSFYATDGTIQSETYVIEDCTYYSTTSYSTSTTLNISLPANFTFEYILKQTNSNSSVPYPDIGSTTNNRILVGQYARAGSNGLIIYKSSNTTHAYGTNPTLNQDNSVWFKYDGTNYYYKLNDGSVMTVADAGITLSKLIHVEGGSGGSIRNLKIKPL